ncbi:hypothetical protein [Pseudonocardia sp. ICBG601]|uniref:hypothetical protein n=1 Tax=Pseudonocardia sp. ICBG601 TaxID=2846759 RepID=UPI001CF63577|nr:hypothetical protein [Pseudonocardia sp. ICBG601]
MGVVELTVSDVGAVSHSLVRVELGGDALAPLLASWSEERGAQRAPDEAVVVHVPVAEGGLDPRGRWYTVRGVEQRSDGPRLVLEMVSHEGGIAASWRAGPRWATSSASP